MEWISFFDRQPADGQKIWYYGEPIGVWKGEYKYSPDDPYSPHLMICGERDEETHKVLSEYGLENLSMTVDRMDAPWWMPDDGQDKPTKPSKEYPDDYPRRNN